MDYSRDERWRVFISTSRAVPQEQPFWAAYSRPFWQTLLEALLVALSLRGVAVVLTRAGVDTPWAELFALLSEHALWFWSTLRLSRLEQGAWWWRVSRVVVFGGLLGLGFATANLVFTSLIAPARTFLALPAVLIPEPARVPFEAFMLSTSLRFLFVFAVREVWLEGKRNLRWRLTALALFGGVFAASVVSILPGILTLLRDPSARLTSDAINDAADLAKAFQGALSNGYNENQLKRLFRFLEGSFDSSRSMLLEGTETSNDTNRIAILIDSTGTVLDSNRIDRFSVGDQFSTPELESWQDILQITKSGRCQAKVLNLEVLAACPALSQDPSVPNVVLGVVRSTQVSSTPRDVAAQIGSDLSNALDTMSQSFLPFFLGLGFLGYAVSLRLTRPLELLLSGVQALEEGKFAVRVEADGEDEVARLAQTFNQMASRLEGNMLALRQEKQNVETVLAAKRTLTANASHELRTPIAVMRARLESAELRGEALTPQIILSEVQRLEHLVEDLFALSRADLEQLDVQMQPVFLGELAKHLFSSLNPLAKESNLTFLNDVPERIIPVLADPARLEQVLRNLVMNAVRYTPEGGIVRLAARARVDFVEITVEDTGIGMNQEDLDHIFEPFYRSDPARARATGGAGLGLAVVRELMQRMGGTVRASSIAGQGSVFTLELQGLAHRNP
ncbi:MAG: sensor histidine kinase [Deinococcales bacterium]